MCSEETVHWAMPGRTTANIASVPYCQALPGRRRSALQTLSGALAAGRARSGKRASS